MKKIYLTLVVMILSLATSVAQAADFQVGTLYYNIVSEQNATCAVSAPASGKYEGDIVIPAQVEYEGKTWTVTEIANRAFYSASALTSITMPETVVRLRRGCIDMCNKMTSLQLSANLEYIDSQAISTCNALTSLVLPSKVKYIGYKGVSLAKITTLNIPATLTEIGYDAFYSCSLLTSLDVDPENPAYSYAKGMLLSKDGTRVVMNLPGNMTESLDLPETVTEIDAWAFHGLKSLKSIIIPDRVTKIGKWAFGECRYATEINTGNGITYIPEFAFGWANRCEKLTIGENVTAIGQNAFESYATTIYNKSNQTLVIPSRITHIGADAFTSAAFKELVLSEGIEKVDTLAFSGMNQMLKVTLPSTLKDIRMLAFESMPKITEITLPAGLTTIGDGAFAGCTKLSAVNIPANVKNVGKRAFSKCSALTAITVSEANPYFDTVDGILFTKDHSMLKQYPVGRPDTLYVVPSNVTRIEGGAFAGSSKLRAITVPDNVKSLGIGVFQECSALKQVTLPSDLTELPSASFMSCTQLRQIQLPETLQAIGTQAFYMCQALQTITLPATLKVLGNYAFGMGRYMALKNIYVKSKTPPTCTLDGYPELYTFHDGILINGILHVPQGCIDAYREAPMWKAFKTIEEEVTTGIDDIEDNSGEIRITADNGAIAVTAPEGTPVEVYAISGMKVWTGTAPARSMELAHGIYVVRAGAKTAKVRL